MECFMVYYSQGMTVFPDGILHSYYRKRCPIEFTDLEIILYDYKKQNNLRIKYEKIAYINPWFMPIGTWGFDIQLKTDLLSTMKRDDLERIKKGFPFKNWFPLRGITPSLQFFAIISTFNDKDKLINVFKEHKLKVLDPKNIDKYNQVTYKYGLGYLKKHEGLRVILIISMIIMIIGITSGVLLFSGILFTQTVSIKIRFILIGSLIFLLFMDLLCAQVGYQLIKIKKVY